VSGYGFSHIERSLTMMALAAAALRLIGAESNSTS